MELSPKYLKYYEDCVFLCLLQVEGVSLLLGPSCRTPEDFVCACSWPYGEQVSSRIQMLSCSATQF